jgi:hypothetical protein
LQNDTLYFKDLDGNVCFNPNCAFAITRLSKNQMELEYLGLLPDYILYVRTYLLFKLVVEHESPYRENIIGQWKLTEMDI